MGNQLSEQQEDAVERNLLEAIKTARDEYDATQRRERAKAAKRLAEALKEFSDFLYLGMV